jgi:RNA polymerase subunit RPABC4/transcription elongation factor Spt4
MKKKECPSCAMEVDRNHKVCPVCGYEFTDYAASTKWIALLLIIIFLLIILL